MRKRVLLSIGGALSLALLSACSVHFQPYCRPRIVLVHVDHQKPLYQYIMECGLEVKSSDAI